MSARNAVATRARRALPTQLIWTVALGICALAVAQAGALAVLSPMKTMRTEAKLVDKKAGTTAALAPGASGALTPAVTRALLMQYIRARETFDETDIRPNYAKVIAWSAPAVANEYRGLMTRANPESPLILYPTRTTVSPLLKAISFLSENTALIRFDVHRQDGGNRAGPPQSYTSVILFGFAPTASGDIALNPVGFRVMKYTRNADANGISLLSIPAK